MRASAVRGRCTIGGYGVNKEMLFETGTFTAHSGRVLRWKIECDDLDDAAWDVIAEQAYDVLTHGGLRRYGQVEGVPRGGLRLADVLRKRVSPTSDRLVIVDDVLTTGASMEAQRRGRDASGLVVFDRSGMRLPEWIQALWTSHLFLSYPAPRPITSDDRGKGP